MYIARYILIIILQQEMKGRRSRLEKERRVKRSIVDQMKFMTIYDEDTDRMDMDEYVKVKESEG